MIELTDETTFAPLPPTYDERVLNPLHANIIYPHAIRYLNEKGFRLSIGVSTTFSEDLTDRRRFDSKGRAIGAEMNAVIMNGDKDAISVFDMAINTFDASFLVDNPDISPSPLEAEKARIEAELEKVIDLALMIHTHDKLGEAA